MQIASVILFDSVKSYDFPYDYIVPSHLRISAGVRVTVPFGKGKMRRVGFVLSLRNEEAADTDGLKEIETVIDDEPLLNSEGLQLVYYLHKTTFCLWYEAVKCQIPPGLGMKVQMGYSADTEADTSSLEGEEKRIYDIIASKRNIVDEKALFASLGVKGETKEIRNLIKKGFIVKSRKIRKKILDKKAVMARLIEGSDAKLTPRQEEVKNLLADIGPASVKEISYFLGVTSSVLKNMQKNGAIELYEELVSLNTPSEEEVPERQDIFLNPSQYEAFKRMKEKLGMFSVDLLYGVTGSGKTEVFIKLIEEALKMDMGSLVLIPEISLTPQTAKKFKDYFGSSVAVLNSTLSMTERLEQYKKIKQGICKIVVGTRLSVFSPLENIGLIVIDEEQEDTYHSEMSPRFHARNVAVKRAKFHNCPLLLCSATPSVESFYKAKTGKYELLKLKERYSKKPLPPVHMIDMLKEPFQGDSAIFSERLCQEMRYNLDHKEQTVLLLNRRGYLTRLSCISCREVIKCPNCSVAMTYHQANRKLMCHICGYSCPVPKECPNCGGKMMKYSGEGTQKAEDELKEIFPEAKILRMDADTTMSKNSHEKGFEDFKDGKYDIMIGTQMISKGLNFPLVTLVGILNADQALYTEDYRGFEKAFSLITQTVGRAGRGQIEGRAYIQTFSPDLELFKFCKREDYESFYEEEIGFRKACLYPPFCDMVSLTIKNENEVQSYHDSKLLSDILNETASKSYGDIPLRVLGPTEANPFKRNGNYYMQLLIKCRISVKLLNLLEEVSDNFYAQKKESTLIIDTCHI